uniref:PCI domain-containing protein n=1 Tax=Ditylum brightwellii TaxID=49249 RepID=A0A6U3XGS4_9STRA|mmetsp:Transcript_17764/g.23513  ORF Transcript_17764/g.23513 Transcript_17764/m.23513 type:complete len:419 (+) Transcript_17764:1286-2542(+)
MASYVDTSAAALEHLEQMSTLHPDLSDAYTNLSNLFNRKLWHQLTISILSFVSTPTETLRTTAEGTNSYLALFDRVVLAADKKLNQLSLARIASAVASSLLLKSTKSKDGLAAKAVLENLLEKKARLGVPATLYTEAKLSLLTLSILEESGSSGEDETNKILESTKIMLKANKSILAELADGTESDTAIVHSAYYETAMTYRKAVGPPEAYYKEAMQFLSYTPLASLVPERQYALATDLSLAALTGDGVFNFGEVVQSPILHCLENTEKGWLLELMNASAKGDVSGFTAITERHAADIQNTTALAARAVQVKEKITLLALVNMVFERPSSERTLSFEDIAERIQMPKDAVELVIMRALSLGLIKGCMDQVDEIVEVSWVMPRVLDTEQMKDLGERFGEWAVKVSKTKDFMEEQIPTLA